ncbi:btb poz domain-containing protein [Fusarium denticulatum]|uniref:Btb poz domain-containing protein n=1 Tax=Fusarium denticulatum TaxID=48507 RepID=A0A8H5TCS1_9HYPO|nr:btb poz domain-containing protein [Fusarium denticulatum]
MANETGPEIVDIVTDGDVILVVGPDKRKLRVKSMLLMAASKPFSAMLGPSWKEGHDMRQHGGSHEVLLPDDNASAMEIICSVIHFQNHKIPQTLPASDVLAVTLAADKYDFLNAIQLAQRAWLWEVKVKPEDLMLLAAVAYLIRDAQAFRDITAALVLNHHGSYLALSGEDTESIMPWEVLYLLEEQRGFARLQLSHILISGVNLGQCSCPYGWTSKQTSAYIRQLFFEDLWPANFYKMSISGALQKAELMPDPVPLETSNPCANARYHQVPAYRQNLTVAIERLNKSVGLCLECVREGSDTFMCIQRSHRSKD